MATGKESTATVTTVRKKNQNSKERKTRHLKKSNKWISHVAEQNVSVMIGNIPDLIKIADDNKRTKNQQKYHQTKEKNGTLKEMWSSGG